MRRRKETRMRRRRMGKWTRADDLSEFAVALDMQQSLRNNR